MTLKQKEKAAMKTATPGSVTSAVTPKRFATFSQKTSQTEAAGGSCYFWGVTAVFVRVVLKKNLKHLDASLAVASRRYGVVGKKRC